MVPRERRVRERRELVTAFPAVFSYGRGKGASARDGHRHRGRRKDDFVVRLRDEMLVMYPEDSS